MRDMARLMEGAPFGEGKIFWDQTPQGALYWNEVYCNLLSLANPPEEDVSKERKTKLVFYRGINNEGTHHGRSARIGLSFRP